jgi:hypothetical protein
LILQPTITNVIIIITNIIIIIIIIIGIFYLDPPMDPGPFNVNLEFHLKHAEKNGRQQV